MARPPLRDRMLRMLAILSWLADKGEATFDELVEQFSVDREVLRRELETAAMCGLPPYTPDQLIELIVERDRVVARIPPYFKKPPVFSKAERLAVYTAAKRLLQFRDWPELEMGILKLARHYGETGEAIVVAEPPSKMSTDLMRKITDAIRDKSRIRLSYWSATREELTSREVDPLRIEEDMGNSYLIAFDHASQETRIFRVDRIKGLETTGETFEITESHELQPGVFHPDADATRARIAIPRRMRWMLEYMNAEDVVEKDGCVEATVLVASENWLATMLLQAGPPSRIISPSSWNRLVADKAREILALYDE